ncbi:hypothetical protein H0B56_13465 [Haloechinothrix sp. YIM 98757]|uniref:Uncharacterized protein n=1 Tax=Haloechinothrix aidingensis TaxID=2752311 RepID=A0A838ABD9_9PSEU|nr:hypothetical protein [Haloechinothrix aidingensis]MBA0126554.1 hypothetical protein [Haloechinothrix aidingensis]
MRRPRHDGHRQWLAVRPARRPTRRRFRRAVLLAAVFPPLCVPGVAAGGEGTEQHSCPVVAAAQGVRMMASKSDDIFLSAPTGVAAPAAQSCVDYGLGESTGFASNPYPGANVVALPGLLGGQTGQEFPGYPAYVSSRHPGDPESSVSEDGYTLSSRSEETSTEARAGSGHDEDDAGAAVAGARATSVVDPQESSSEATAASTTRPLVINDVLELGQVRSSAKAAVDSRGELSRTAELEVGRTRVGGQEVVVTPDGVEAAGEGIELPDGPDPNEVLEQAGVRVRYLDEVETPRGVLSAGVEVIAEQRVETAVYTAHYTFGRAFAAADTVAEGPAGAGADAEIPAGVQGSGSPAVPEEQGPAAAGAPEDAGGAGTGKAVSEGDAPEEARAPEAEAAPEEASTRLASEPMDMGMAGVYLVIVFGGLATVTGGTLLRLLGVRTRWIS